jgi:uncharacterized damage-inducible protein DinB
MADFRDTYLRDIVRTYKNYKALGERALAQMPDAHLHTELDANSNSVAVIVKHVAGNLRSRFSEFLTTDGEKPDRNRDGEFEMPERASREEMLRWWEMGWTTALESIEALRPEDLERTVHIRRESFAVVEALNRSITHTAYHVGQIVYLARHFADANWKSLSIPRGMSSQVLQGDFKSHGIAR